MALYAHGYDNVAMYDGSWTEWKQDATTPKDDLDTMLTRSPVQPEQRPVWGHASRGSFARAHERGADHGKTPIRCRAKLHA